MKSAALRAVEQQKTERRLQEGQDVVANAANNSNNSGWDKLGNKVHRQLHHQPKAHERRFSWLEYQFDRKISAMHQRSTGLAGQMAAGEVRAQQIGGGWEDLNATPNVSCWNQKWSWTNFMYKWTDFCQEVTKWWHSWIGLQVNDINIKLYGSHKGVFLQNLNLAKAQKKYNTTIIHPYSNLRLVWDIVMILLLLLQMIMVPTNLAFSGKIFHSRFWVYILNYLTDVIFLIDIYLSFKTGYLIDKTEVVLDPDEIKSNYVRGWFMIDLPSTVPVDVILAILFKVLGQLDPTNRYDYTIKNNQVLRIVKLGKIMKVLKILRINRILRYVKMFEQMYEDSYDVLTFWLTSAKNMALIMLVLHINSCLIWSYSVMDTCRVYEGKPSWSVKRGLYDRYMENPKEHFIEVYYWSMFKATSNMLCIGYGFEPSENICDLYVTLFTLFTGAALFAIMIGTIINQCQSLHISERIYNNKYRHVTEYMRFRGLPYYLQERMYMYYEYRFQGKVFDENAIHNELNPVMRNVVRQYNQMWLVSSAQVFEDCSSQFRDVVCNALTFELYLPDDTLFSEGERATRIYFISRGRVKIEIQKEVVGRKLDGEILGELCMIFPDHDRVCTAVCETCTHVYQLELSRFQEITAHFRRDYLEILRYAKFRIEDEETFYDGEALERESMCRFMGIDKVGTDARASTRSRVFELKQKRDCV